MSSQVPSVEQRQRIQKWGDEEKRSVMSSVALHYGAPCVSVGKQEQNEQKVHSSMK
jgi:hypothetical protein